MLSPFPETPIVFLKAQPVDPDVDLAEAKADLAEALLNDPNSPEIASLAAKVAKAYASSPASRPPETPEQAKAAAKVAELVSGNGSPLVVEAARKLKQIGFLEGLDGLSALRAVVEMAKHQAAPPATDGDEAEDLIKSTVLKEILVPAYTRSDGTHVPEHRKMVHVNPTRTREDVLSGRGSYSQREAHSRLSRMPHWNSMHPDHQYAHILSHATAIQSRRSSAAAVSGWRSRARNGQNPTPSQWAAFYDLPVGQQVQELAALPSTSHLSAPSREVQQVPADPTPRATTREEVVQAVTAPAAEPLPQPEREAIRAAMTAVRLPANGGQRSNSAAHASFLRRLGQLQEMAAAGDLDGVTNFSVPDSESHHGLAQYRMALINAAHDARQLASPAAVPVSREIPLPPTITGANPNNTALIASQRKVQALYAAAQSADPIPAILAIPTSRGNGYMNRADDYKTALLRHFGYDHAGQSSREAEPAPPSPPPAAAPQKPPREPNNAVPPDRDPVVAGILADQPDAPIDFVPRPNIPIESWRVTRTGAQHIPSGVVIPWPDARFADLARRYISQSASLQHSARRYVRKNLDRLAPVLPVFQETLTRTVAEQERERTERQERERRDLIKRSRAASRRYLDELEALPDLLKPRSRLGANISQVTGSFASAGAFFEVSEEVVKDVVNRMVADYGQNVSFTAKVETDSYGVAVIFKGSDGTEIIRRFRRKDDGSLYVNHSYFKAGRKGEGAGKALFRCSIGAYLALGVKRVDVHANIDVGGYAWAKYGFLMRTLDWQRLAESFRRRMSNLRLSDTGNRRLTEILNDPKPEAAFLLADFKDGERNVGKELLLNSHWLGKLDLTNKASYRRCIGYISR